MEQVKVFLMDDHQVVREGVRALLEATGKVRVVGEASCAAEALARVATVQPDVAVLDVRVPDGNGIEVCREIRSRHDIPCLMLTSFSDDDALMQAVLAGASGYILKQVRGNDLVESVLRVASGRSILDSMLTRRVLDRLQTGPAHDARLAQLSPQERRILHLIAGGLTNRQIAAQIFLAEKTVKNYVSNLLTKLGMARRTEAAVFAVRLEAAGVQVEV